MRVKKSIIHRKRISSTNKPASELDPTRNFNLYLDIWKKLMDKLANPMPKRNISPHSSDQQSQPPLSPSDGRLFGQDVRRVIKVVCNAVQNPSESTNLCEDILAYGAVYIPWDVQQYYSECVQGGNKPASIKYPNPEFGTFCEPLTVVDSKGRIVLWYLPGLLSQQDQLDVRTATTSIRPLLKQSLKLGNNTTCTPNWRVNEDHFTKENRHRTCEPGNVNFSAGWFAQAHETEEYPLLPSVNMRTQRNLGHSDWLKKSNRFERILNLTLSLIHPTLFKCGLDMLQKLRLSPLTMEIAKQWQSVYTGIAVISNRLTLPHRDSRGKPEWFDLLLNYAGNDSNPKLLINDLGLELDYSSGTVVGLCGTIFQHEVGYWGEGDRVCYAHFMREAVRNRLQAEDPGWVYQSTYFPGPQ